MEYNLMFVPENPEYLARKMDGTPYLGATASQPLGSYAYEYALGTSFALL